MNNKDYHNFILSAFVIAGIMMLTLLVVSIVRYKKMQKLLKKYKAKSNDENI